ncbi:maleylpyruvate isomerase family mycothiol-dependent enzyme [Occultella gossypii]|uniref:Maleylpyruvate isomerase family mycothiol-dependent enzyme n=1 Tax=Occultella gossypii TaxID=2800820 RepID=A0ABS7S576_9MICO|nr:maleylpyruvate isomerase family mycothiol-dependent enzyme [Occultella gossypii]MBZ2195496.1 maleylpyruvate isomerase family mycothiol-dependent enzyme [Occultella gossypii]
MSTVDTAMLPVLGTSYAALADALASVDEARWREPSMCAGWTVANVIAHLTMAARYDEAAFTAELAADGFDFQTMSDRLALRDGALPVDSLLADLRSDTMATFAMPVGGVAGSLSHVVIHGLDATWPLGLECHFPTAATHLVLDGLADTSPTMFGVEIDGLALSATDLDWRHGQGRPVERPAAELVLALAGRHIAL